LNQQVVIRTLGLHGKGGAVHIVDDFDDTRAGCGASIKELMGDYPFAPGNLADQQDRVPGKLCGTCGLSNFPADWNERVRQEKQRRANLSPTIPIAFCRNQSGSGKVVHILLPNRDDDMTLCSQWSGEILGIRHYPRGPLAPNVSTTPYGPLCKVCAKSDPSIYHH
jgi:hypothetical protein